MIEVTLYSRKDCHLCEIARTYLDELQSDVPHHLTELDVDSDARLRSQYGFNVPVVVVGPYKLSAPIEKRDLEISLQAVKQSIEQEAKLDRAIEEGRLQIPVKWTKSDNLSLWLARHYLAIFNIFVFLYLGGSFLAPILMKAGATAPANVVYRAYGFVCHQLAFRSFFLFGEQSAYPRAEANIEGVISYQQATGLDGYDLLAARAFVGDEQLGYKVALCERDVDIYGGILIFGLIFAIFRRKIKSIHWILWIVIGILPIAIDGLSQLFSQPPLNFLPLRESTPFLRTLTGFLFGFMTAWFGYPYVEASMHDNRKFLEGKQSQANKWAAEQGSTKE
ncbi:MAG: hypothetical protein C3F13_15200 [Anaerolineales bacterium]|nr:MAG: hypothetical protein C3F13_15200 [Anaerolineales bacterium]